MLNNYIIILKFIFIFLVILCFINIFSLIYSNLKNIIINYFIIIGLFFFFYNFFSYDFFFNFIDIVGITLNHKNLILNDFINKLKLKEKNIVDKNNFYIMFKGGDIIKTELFSINKTIFESFVKLELFISPFKKLLNVNINDFFLIKKGYINLPNYEFKTGEELELFNNIKKILVYSKLNKLKFKLDSTNFLKINNIVIVDANFFFILKAFVKLVKTDSNLIIQRYHYITINNNNKIRTSRFFYNFLSKILYKIKGLKIRDLNKKIKTLKKNNLVFNTMAKNTDNYFAVDQLYSDNSFIAIKKVWDLNTNEQQIYILYKNFVNNKKGFNNKIFFKNKFVGINPVTVEFLPLFSNWLFLKNDSDNFKFEKIKQFIKFLEKQYSLSNLKYEKKLLQNVINQILKEIYFNSRFNDVSCEPSKFAKIFKKKYFNEQEWFETPTSQMRKSKFFYLFLNNYDFNYWGDRDLQFDLEYVVWLFTSLNLLEPLAYLDPKHKITQSLIVEIINFYFNTKFFDYSWNKFNKSYNYDLITKYYPANIFFDNFKNKSYEQELFFENIINYYKNQICNTFSASNFLKKEVQNWNFKNV